jgi:hypothetical protein
MDAKSNTFLPGFFLSLANILFHFIHLAVITFFLLGWLWDRTLTAHFVLSLLILISWCGLGMIYGFGYCLITDIQWKIKKRLGQKPDTEFYIKYMADKLTGLDTDPRIVDAITTYTFFIIFFISTLLFLNKKFSFF